MKKYLIMVLCAALTLMCLAGCGNDDVPTGETSLAVVARISSNFGDIPVNSQKLSELMHSAAKSYGQISIIRCDGKPYLVGNYDIAQPEISGLSEERLKTEENKAVNAVLAAFQGANAVEPEVDTLQAITLAASTIRESDGVKILLVLDSGLSTAGYLDFTKGLLWADPDDIVAALEKAHALPDLSGICVNWMFLGQTADPQPELSNAQIDALRNIWSRVLYAAGAEDVKFSDKDKTIAADRSNAPYVSIVDAEARAINVPILIPNEKEPVMETVVLDESRVRFLGNQAVFAEPAEASTAIGAVASALSQNPDIHVLVVGTTAGTGTTDFSLALSQARAEAVRDELVAFGIDPSRMTCLGLGADDPWHVADIDPATGAMIEAQACQNRKVMIIDRNSDDAGQLGPWLYE